MSKIILHITSVQEWSNAIQKQAYAPPSLEIEGFIHCSTIEQTLDTANRFFSGRDLDDLLLLVIEEEQVRSDLKYEAPITATSVQDKQSLFPHIYRAIHVEEVKELVHLKKNKNEPFQLPIEIEKYR